MREIVTVSTNNAFDVLNLLEENQQVFREDVSSSGDLATDDLVAGDQANVDVVNASSSKRAGFNDWSYVYNNHAQRDWEPFINQPDNLPISQDELDTSSSDSSDSSHYSRANSCGNWRCHMCYKGDYGSSSDEAVELALEEEEDYIHIPYEAYYAHEEFGKQRLKRMFRKRCTRTKLMKLKQRPKCCCSCTRLIKC